MLNDANIVPLTLENIDAFFDGTEYGNYCVGTVNPMTNAFKGEPNKSGKIKEELLKRLDAEDDLYFQYETIYD